ncbi:Phosphate transporter domain containing protein [Aphelenchoides besseyi]|nr:Phosphate transporter domain containing protein [Aphelenchoides besseyi]KAI6237474.1 Phosphate transporter domain containing protein [Aphelenchoides besseyi]
METNEDDLPFSVFRVSSSNDNFDTTTFFTDEIEDNFTKELRRTARFHHYDHLLWAVITGVVAFIFASFSLSANGVANAVGVAVGAGVLKIRHAVYTCLAFQLIAFVYVALTASQTEFQYVIDLKSYHQRRSHLLLGQVALLIGLATINMVTTYKKFPISTGQSVVGASIGFTVVLNGVHGVRWSQIVPIVLTWIFSPILSSLCSLFVFSLIDKFILRKKNYLEYTSWLLPVLYFFSTSINVFALMQQTVNDFNLANGIPFQFPLLTSLMLGFVVALLVWFFIEPMLRTHIEFHELQNLPPLPRDPPTIRIKRFRVKKVPNPVEPTRFMMTVDGGRTQVFNQIRKTGIKRFHSILNRVLRKFIHKQKQQREYAIEYQFGSALLFTASFAAFMQSIQNIRESIVPLASLISVYKHHRLTSSAAPNPLIVSFVLFSICSGIILWGARVIETVGKLAKLNAVTAFVAQISTITTVVVSHQLGILASTTCCQVGAIITVGLASDPNGVDWKLARNVLIVWAIALFGTGILVAILSYFLHFSL